MNEEYLEKQKICRQYDLNPEDIEVWIVCDKDDMTCSLQELEDYVSKNQMNLAF